MQNLLELNARVEASEIELGNRAGYGEHYLMPYRGFHFRGRFIAGWLRAHARTAAYERQFRH